MVFLILIIFIIVARIRNVAGFTYSGCERGEGGQERGKAPKDRKGEREGGSNYDLALCI